MRLRLRIAACCCCCCSQSKPPSTNIAHITYLAFPPFSATPNNPPSLQSFSHHLHLLHPPPPPPPPPIGLIIVAVFFACLSGNCSHPIRSFPALQPPLSPILLRAAPALFATLSPLDYHTNRDTRPPASSELLTLTVTPASPADLYTPPRSLLLLAVRARPRRCIQDRTGQRYLYTQSVPLRPERAAAVAPRSLSHDLPTHPLPAPQSLVCPPRAALARRHRTDNGAVNAPASHSVRSVRSRCISRYPPHQPQSPRALCPLPNALAIPNPAATSMRRISTFLARPNIPHLSNAQSFARRVPGNFMPSSSIHASSLSIIFSNQPWTTR